MLLKKLINSYWYIGILLFSISAFVGDEDNKYMLTLATAFVPFIFLGIVTYKSIRWRDNMFTKTNLFSITLFCSLITVFCNQLLSLYIDGDQFVFSKTDAFLYYRYATQLGDMDFAHWSEFLNNCGFGIDDWAAFIFMGLVFSFAKSQTLMAIIYCVIGAFTALNIFYIGRSIMCRRYAFIAALSLSLASFILVMHSVFLKETVMLYVIILAFRYFYAFLNTKQIKYILLAYGVAMLIFMFRTPVALLAIMSFSFTLIFRYVHKAFLPIIFVVGMAILMTSSAFIYTYDRYMAGGDVGRILERKNSLSMGGGAINHIADPAAALTGPFPGLIVNNTTNKLTIINSSGLILRLLIVLPFILGIYYIIRYRQTKMYALAMFFIVNALGVAVTVKGLEVRISIPHLFAAYLVAFWWMAHYDYRKFHIKLPGWIVNISILGVLAICILWNLRSYIMK